VLAGAGGGAAVEWIGARWVAAGLAGLAAGVWRDANEFLATRRFTRFEPRMDRDTASSLLHGWERAVHAAIGWARTAPAAAR
jgi:glycerol kinase